MEQHDEKLSYGATSQSIVKTMDIDDAELETAGYNRAMPRQFSTVSLMALSFNLSATWMGTIIISTDLVPSTLAKLTILVGIGTSMGIALAEASSAGTIWSLVVAGAFTAILSAGLAELASAYPIAGAQYYWACEFDVTTAAMTADAPQSWSRATRGLPSQPSSTAG